MGQVAYILHGYTKEISIWGQNSMLFHSTAQNGVQIKTTVYFWNFPLNIFRG
jgi:hypothetical protein